MLSATLAGDSDEAFVEVGVSVARTTRPLRLG